MNAEAVPGQILIIKTWDTVCHWLARPCCSQNGAYTGLLGLSGGYTWKGTEAHCRDWCVQTLKGDAGHSGWHVITGHTWQTWVKIDGRKWHSDPAPLNLDRHRKSLQIVKPFLNLSRKNQQTVKALLSGYLFSFFFTAPTTQILCPQDFHWEKTSLSRTVIYTSVDMYMCLSYFT